jgi:glucose-6-phosphate dehydrogenase assembly protein OpcA
MSVTSNPLATKSHAELGIEVPVHAIDRELHKLRAQDESRTHASLINLVVYSEKPGALLENSAIVRHLTREHACRAILVEVDPNQAMPGIQAWITAHCHLDNGRRSVCCEQIALHLTGKVTGRFRNTVFAHLDSDLPLVFWWQGELSDIFSERLVSVIDRLIVDSSSWENPAESFRKIEKASHSNSQLILQDHAWSRTWQFRLGVASIFDEPTAQRAIAEIDRVEITHHPDHRNSALQLLAWLATQAGWRDAKRDTGKTAKNFTFVSPAGIAIEAQLSEDAAAPPLSRLVLRAGERMAVISQAAGSAHVERRIEAPGYQASSLSPIDPVSAGDLVAMQLSRGGKNSLFAKILPRFRAMLE